MCLVFTRSLSLSLALWILNIEDDHDFWFENTESAVDSALSRHLMVGASALRSVDQVAPVLLEWLSANNANSLRHMAGCVWLG